MNLDRLEIRVAKLLDAVVGRLLVRLAPRRRVEQRTPTDEARKILFIKFWGLGSIVLSLPALELLRELHPRAEIHYLTLAQNRDLFALIPHVATVHSIVFGNPVAFVWRCAALARRLRRESYDLIVDAEFFANVSALLAHRARARRLIGFSQPASPKKRLLDASVPFAPDRHTAEQFRDLVHEGRNRLPPCPRPRLALARGKAARPYVVMNANASALAVERRWPLERFAELARALLERYAFDVALVGSPAEALYVARLERLLAPSERVRNLAGKLDLVALARLIVESAVFISNDSGPIHLAAALGVPVVGFYGPETPARYGPLAPARLVFYRDLWCSPCMSLDNSKTVHCINALACMKGIETADVIPRVFEFIDSQVSVS